MSVQIPDEVDLRKYIEVRLFGERPHIRGRRIPVATIVGFARNEDWTIERTAYEFSLSEAEVLSAMLYYQEYKNEIDAQEIEEDRKFQELKQTTNEPDRDDA